MDSVEFKQSRWYVALAPFGVAFALLIAAVLFLASILFLVLWASGKEVATAENGMAVSAPVMLFFSAWMAVSAWQQRRYKHALGTRYIVTSQGITIESKSFRRLVRWEEFQVAEHLRLFSLLRLQSVAVSDPVVLLMDGQVIPSKGSTIRDAFAKRLIETQMGERYKTRWLP